MLGWSADFFRFWWGLLYWNTRKSWFRLRRGQSPCPCQCPSDSGRARETQCDACSAWARPGRFRRVCPLLVDTPDGLRCSADTADVRPFWGRALGFYGGAILCVYLVGAVGVFAFLRKIGYPVSILQVTLPPLWSQVGQARGWFFLDRSARAFAEGRTNEGLLYLANAYEFDPTNYGAGLGLAKILQPIQPRRSDEVFRQLLREHPDRREATAQEWFRALLPRGSFAQITSLARDELLAGSPQAAVWIRALLVAVRQTGDDTPLRTLLASDSPAAKAWHDLIEVELLRLAGRLGDVRRRIEQPWNPRAPAFTLYYRAEALIELGETFAALDLVAKHSDVLDAEAAATLRLTAYAAAGMVNNLRRQADELLAPPYHAGNLALPKILCAHLIRFPDAALFERLHAKLRADDLPMNTETAGVWFSLLCAAGAVGDQERLAELAVLLRPAGRTPLDALAAVAGFFRGDTAERRVTAFLPLLPLPLEVTYALLERYAPPAPKKLVRAAPAAPRTIFPARDARAGGPTAQA